jgi:hypothetical protein
LLRRVMFPVFGVAWTATLLVSVRTVVLVVRTRTPFSGSAAQVAARRGARTEQRRGDRGDRGGRQEQGLDEARGEHQLNRPFSRESLTGPRKPAGG